MDRFDEMRTKAIAKRAKELAIAPKKVTAIRGESQQFTANGSVTWSIDGNTDVNTTISNTGMLNVSKYEKSNFITIIATSKDKKAYAQATIKAKYLIKFHVFNGTFEDGSTTPIKQIYYTGEKLRNIPKVVPIEGYEFKGWSSSQQGDPIVNLRENMPVNGNVTYSSLCEPKINFVEYIESTGTQWIDTEIFAKSTLKSQLKFNMTEVTGDVIYGYIKNSDTDDYRFFNYNSKAYLDFPGTATVDGVRIYGGTISANTTYEIEIGNYYVKNLITGTNIISGATQNTFTKTNTMKMWKDERSNKCSKGKLYYLKIYDGDTLVRDFKPCIDSNGVACLYDMVTEKCFYNKGTGNFITP